MANGTPIRLIQRNGGIIELNVTTVTMDVDRKFNPKPLVYSGSHRVATDSNLTRAVIQLEGFIADDDAVFVSSSTQASASIDFSYRIDGVRKIGDEITDDEKEDMVRNLATYWRPGTISNIRTPKLALDDTNVIYFVEDSASDGYTGSVHWVSLSMSQPQPPNQQHLLLKVLQIELLLWVRLTPLQQALHPTQVKQTP